MTPYERVMARLKGKPVDRIPNLAIIMMFASKYIDQPYDKYVTDYKVLVEGNIRCCEDFGIDMLSAISDPMREAHGFGAEVVIPPDGVPYSPVPYIKEYSDISKLKVKDPSGSERMADRLAAVELYRTRAGRHYPVLGWVEGAFAEACDLKGISNLMADIYEEPDFVHELLEICTQQAIAFARAQVRAGADFIGIGDAAASLIGPQSYREFVLPYEKRIIDAVHEENAFVKLHICGNITSILEDIRETGADMVDVDWMVSFKDAVNALSGASAACGNFDPVAVLLEGNETLVEQAVRSCAAQGNDQTFIAAGCEVPRNTPSANLMVVTKTLETLGTGSYSKS